MSMTPPNLIDCLESYQGGEEEAVAAEDDNQVGPFWAVG